MRLKILVLLALTTLACNQPAPNGASYASYEAYLQTACRHEAGHTLYALQFPARLQLVQTYLVKDSGNNAGAYTEFNSLVSADDYSQIIVLVGMDLAGEVSNKILTGSTTSGVSRDDRAKATERATKLLGGDSGNVPHVLRLAEDLARGVLMDRKADLRQIADELYRRKKLTAYDVRRIVTVP